MAGHKLHQPSVFGRIGTSLGSYLAESIPKEVDRQRLAGGLENIEKAGNKSPLSQAASLIRSGANESQVNSFLPLIRQQEQADELIKQSKQKKQSQQNDQTPANPYPKREPETQQKEKPVSVTTPEGTQATLENYIPKTFEQLQIRAGELMEARPALYGNDPAKALSAAQAEEGQAQAINQAYQTRRGNEEAVQGRIKQGFQDQATRLEAEVPGTVYSDIEDKAIKAVKPKDKGGEGLTEQQAQKKYGKELDDISREYKGIYTVGDLSILTRSPSENKRTLGSLRTKFKDRDDLENFALTMVEKNDISPSKAFLFAKPVSDYKEINNELVKTPELNKRKLVKENENLSFPEIDQLVEDKTIEVAKKIAPLLKGTAASPLAIAEELNAKGYDPKTWLKFIDDNRKKYDISESQGRELAIPENFFPKMNDFWLFTLSGLDKLVEIK